MRGRTITVLMGVAAMLGTAALSLAQGAPAVRDDPLVRMPGTQPGQVALEAPDRCLNCHAGYNTSVEPGFNWQGSMMSQSARDPLFWAAMTVAAQDSQWALGRPNGSDLCLRCHFPKGWLEGRSDPTSGIAMTGADFDGVQCDFCHRMYDPQFEATYSGLRESDDWSGYWDETNASDTPSQPAADSTRAADAAAAAGETFFNGSPFFEGTVPAEPGYTEGAGGQYFVDPDAAKRASFADADARHQMAYSRFHKSAYHCGTCHDVSNAALANLAFEGTAPGDGATILPTEALAAGNYFHIERTFSEFLLSAYAAPGGAPGEGPFAPEVLDTSTPGNAVSRCQDCHMRDVVGTGADKQGVPIRPDGSTEHPSSGQPLHDFTGGNLWMPVILASTVPGSPNYDSVNADLLGQGPAALVLDLTQGLGVNPEAMLAGSDRALQQLLMAAALEEVAYDAVTGELSFRVQNQTGHKLISGFPEGRRMFVNVVARDETGTVIAELNPYDYEAGTLRGLPTSASSPELSAGQAYVDELVYEVHQGSSLTGEQETFHVVLADGRYKDNRIPPKGFDLSGAADRLVTPVWHGVEDPQLFEPEEYAGGYDEVEIDLVAGAASVEIGVYYQTTSREYVEFLRNEINGPPFDVTLPDAAYVASTDPFFDRLASWGDTIWALWEHNRDLPGAAPVLIAEATVSSGPPPPELPPAPTLESAVPGHASVSMGWGAVHGSGSPVDGYRVYYSQQDKLQPITDVGLVTSFVDDGLTDGQEYCYRVAALAGAQVSEPSNVLCAVPEPNPHENVAPDVSLSVPGGATEGEELLIAASFADGDSATWIAAIDYDDGSSDSPPAGDGTVEAHHTFVDSGIYTVELCVTDDGGATGCDVVQIAVANVAPEVGAEPDAVVGIGQALVRTVEATDRGSDSLTVTARWGDGSTTVYHGASAQTEVDHSWDGAGTFVVELTVSDDDGASNATSFEVVVGPECGRRPATLVISPDNPTVTPTEGNDVIIGSAGADSIDGGAGNDRICGGGGNDVLVGGDGHDRLFGGGGADLLIGGWGRDRLYGQGGNDLTNGGPGVDRIWGGRGDDLLRGKGGNDLIWGGGGADEIYGERRHDDLWGEGGDDRLFGGPGSDTADGGADTDTCSAESTVRCE